MKKENVLLKWQTYMRYLLLSASIFLIQYLSDIWGVEGFAVNTAGLIGWGALFMFYAVGIFLADNVIIWFIKELEGKK